MPRKVGKVRACATCGQELGDVTRCLDGEYRCTPCGKVADEIARQDDRLRVRGIDPALIRVDEEGGVWVHNEPFQSREDAVMALIRAHERSQNPPGALKALDATVDAMAAEGRGPSRESLEAMRDVCTCTRGNPDEGCPMHGTDEFARDVKTKVGAILRDKALAVVDGDVGSSGTLGQGAERTSLERRAPRQYTLAGKPQPEPSVTVERKEKVDSFEFTARHYRASFSEEDLETLAEFEDPGLQLVLVDDKCRLIPKVKQAIIKGKLNHVPPGARSEDAFRILSTIREGNY